MRSAAHARLSPVRQQQKHLSTRHNRNSSGRKVPIKPVRAHIECVVNRSVFRFVFSLIPCLCAFFRVSVVACPAQPGHEPHELPVRVHRQQSDGRRDRHRRIAQGVRPAHQRHRGRARSHGITAHLIEVRHCFTPTNQRFPFVLLPAFLVRRNQLERAKDQFIGPLENFRKEHIGGAKVRFHLQLHRRKKEAIDDNRQRQ